MVGTGASNQCTSCPDYNSSFRIDNTSISKQCLCISGYTQVVGNPICAKCDVSCAECFNTTPNGCLACPTGANRIDQHALASRNCPCQPGFQEVGLTNCSNCSRSCNTCDQNNKSLCLSCPANMNRIDRPNSNNDCPCVDGYYDDGVNRLCKNCHISC